MNDMERIQQGLEDFLQQELKEESSGVAKPRTEASQEPQLYDLRQPKEPEKELDVINTKHTSARRSNRAEAAEDWDREPRRRSGNTHRAQEPSERRSREQQPRRRGYEQPPRRREKEEPPRCRAERTGSRRTDRRDRRKPAPKRHVLRRILIVLTVLVVAVFGGLYLIEGPIYAKLNYEEIESLTGAPMQENGVVNILLIGNDSRENGEDGRSDAMILLSISKKTKKIYMTSLLRDMYVEIPGYDGNRLNAAYSYGGAELLLETVEQNFDITVNRYVLVNFEAFANLVDAVGGVDLELTNDEVLLVNGYLWEYNILTEQPEGTDYLDTSLEGLIHLDGPQALAYTRNRYIGTDFGRTERQRKVLNEVIKKLPKALVTNPVELVDGLMPNLTTNLTRWECYRLSLMAPRALTYDIESGSIPLEGTYQDATIREMSVLEVDFDANKEYLQELLYGDGTD